MVSFSSTSGLNTPDDSGRSLRCNNVTFWATFRKLARLPVPSLRHHAWFIAWVFAYGALCLVIAARINAADKISFAIYSNEIHLMAVLFFVSFFIGHALYVTVVKRPEALTSHILNELKTRYVTKDRILNALPVLLCMPFFISVFTSFKSILPLANPYSWDPLFADWDRILHGGIHPWQLMHGILGRPLMTSILNFFYNLWFFIMYGVLFWQAFSMRNPRLRMQFFLTFTASWALLGTVAAALFSSGGPCFYGRITGLPDPYLSLMDYLRQSADQVPVWSLAVQDMLWEAYESGKVGFGSGISAMPSMHISSVFLFALVGVRTCRLLGITFSAYALVIFIGSIHLGWHYAIDGYVAIVGTWILWILTGRITRAGSGLNGLSTRVSTNLKTFTNGVSIFNFPIPPAPAMHDDSTAREPFSLASGVMTNSKN